MMHGPTHIKHHIYIYIYIVFVMERVRCSDSLKRRDLATCDRFKTRHPVDVLWMQKR